MKKFLQTLLFFLLVTQICFAQLNDSTNALPERMDDVLPIKPPHSTHTPGLSPLSLHPSFYDRKPEWQWIIDSTWGPGESLTGKLATFDIYQNYARAYNSTFLWNPINWDSLATVLRSQIIDSTSRGGFARILGDLTFGLNDGHAYAYDNIVYYTPLNPGTPLLVDGGGYINHFGAGLTPLADSSLLVYKVVPNHPLGLVPGDIILGYEGVPWSQIVRELLDGNVPHTLWIGGSKSSTNRVLLWAAGESWHMFDTIDVVKYANGLTEHLPLDPMVNLVAPSNYINNEQLPVPGVPMPLYNQNSGAVTYGIIQGTNIGYIYVYHEGYAAVSLEFDEAVLALMQTDGLIIDIRFNWGGAYGLNDGISRLMNHSTLTMDVKKRCSPNDLFSLCPYTPSFWIGEIPADVGTFYDNPIAVLLGPNCLSYGDVTSWQLSYVPNAKMFGRSPQAIYSGMWSGVAPQPYKAGYSLECPNLTLVDHYDPEIPRWGQEYPNFEEVWLTPDGVANGEDDVVSRAVEWMNNLVYPHNIVTDKTYYIPGVDSAHIYATIENPNS
ncbi:MAG: S41 family peptidase, partial [Ignavibacteriaceae bacterium]|nr:S41 family peptidase [Ignavibacteriaceae bacterium]